MPPVGADQFHICDSFTARMVSDTVAAVVPDQRSTRVAIGKRTKFVLKVVVSASLLIVLARMIDWRIAWYDVRGIPPAIAVATVLLFGLQFVICAWKWQVSLLANGVVAPLGYLLKTYCIGFFFSNFLPSNVGGDIYRSYCSSRYTSLGVATFAVVLERVYGLLALILVAVCGLLWILTDRGTVGIWFFSACVTALTACYFIAPLLFVAMLHRFDRWRAWLPPRLSVIAGTIDNMLTNRLRMFELAAICLLFQVLATAIVAMLFAGIGIYWAIAESAVANGAGSIASILPVSINGLGVAEASFAGVATQFGIGFTEATLVSLLIRILVLPLVVLFGFLYLVEDKDKPAEVAAEVGPETA